MSVSVLASSLRRTVCKLHHLSDSWKLRSVIDDNLGVSSQPVLKIPSNLISSTGPFVAIMMDNNIDLMHWLQPNVRCPTKYVWWFSLTSILALFEWFTAGLQCYRSKRRSSTRCILVSYRLCSNQFNCFHHLFLSESHLINMIVFLLRRQLVVATPMWSHCLLSPVSGKIFLFQSTYSSIDLKLYRQIPLYYSQINPPPNTASREGINIATFASAANLGSPIAANYFMVSNGSTSSSSGSSSTMTTMTSMTSGTAMSTGTGTQSTSVATSTGSATASASASASAKSAAAPSQSGKDLFQILSGVMLAGLSFVAMW